ncbi:MAG: SprT-like domain-containing protein [Pyrinomonadaceae bacterium]
MEDSIKLFLNHMRLVAPGFNVPVHIPRVKRERLASEAGKFVVADGFVSIALSEELLTNSKALRSILAHEVCHYVLNNSGIRESDTENNEKLTDLCMFVSGLGDIFLDGYKTENSKEEYRVGHRLGYLADTEYQFARRYVKRKREYFRPNELDSLRREIAARITDGKVMDRLLTDHRNRFPERNEIEIHQGILESLDKR